VRIFAVSHLDKFNSIVSSRFSSSTRHLFKSFSSKHTLFAVASRPVAAEFVVVVVVGFVKTRISLEKKRKNSLKNGLDSC